MPRKTDSQTETPSEAGEPTEPMIAVENRSKGPLTLELADAKRVPEGYKVLEFGDPLDRGRKTDKGEPLPQPELTIPASVWNVYEETHGEAIQALVEKDHLVIRPVAA